MSAGKRLRGAVERRTVPNPDHRPGVVTVSIFVAEEHLSSPSGAAATASRPDDGRQLPATIRVQTRFKARAASCGRLPRKPMRIAAPCLALVLSLAASSVAKAVEASYDVRWLGVRIATARVTGAFEGQRYSLSIDSRYAVLISRGQITGRAEGELRGGRVLPTAYRLGASGEPEQRSAMTFEAGAARRISIEPPLPPDWNVGRIPLEPQHQRDVIDPLSALVLAAVRAGASRDDACRSTLPVFSGVSRFDVVLSPAEPRPLRRGERREGPPPIACRIRFVPIAGHRPANVTVRELQRAPAMLVEFEPELTGNVRMPRRIEIPTRYGTVSVTRQAATGRVEQAAD
jgi:hypothetical protein